MKIVINACHGGFSLSEEAQKLFCQYSIIEWKDWQEDWSYYDIDTFLRDWLNKTYGIIVYACHGYYTLLPDNPYR